MATASVSSRTSSTLLGLGRALGNRNYRLFFIGQGISLLGTWMTRLATGWLVFQWSGVAAALWLGVVSFAGQIPTFFLAPVAGVLVDRWNRHRLLILTQVLSLLQSALLALVAFSGEPGPIAIWQITFLSLFQGVINAFDMPTRQALLSELVERREDLPNAIALNSSLVNGARLVGPSIAGLLIAVAGAAWCFVIDALSYVAVIVALLFLHFPVRAQVQQAGSLLHKLREGATYAFGFAPIRALLSLLALLSFLSMPYTVLLPVFAVDILQGGPSALGFLTASAGVGALVGALFLAARGSVLGLGRVMVLATLLFGLGLIGFALSRVLWLSLLLLAVTGWGMMVQMAASNTILQTIVEDDKRGRVMSFYSMAFLGMAPFGSLLGGFLAGNIGPEWTVLGSGVLSLVGGLFFASRLADLRTQVRPIYARLGIIPEVATGLQAAAELTRPPEK